MPTTKIVERCFLMNLDRRDDRLHEWMQQLPQPWPFPDVERFAAIDGRRLATPEQWRDLGLPVPPPPAPKGGEGA